jgi:hypothetical protein
MLSGCARYTWQREGVPDVQLVQDRQECQRQAQFLVDDYEFALPRPYWTTPYRDLTAGLADEQLAFRACMQAKGYRLVKEPSR